MAFKIKHEHDNLSIKDGMFIKRLLDIEMLFMEYLLSLNKFNIELSI